MKLTNPLPVTLDPQIVEVLRMLPRSGEYNRRAFVFLRAYRRCVVGRIAAMHPETSLADRLGLVRGYQQALLDELRTILAEYQGTEGGAP